MADALNFASMHTNNDTGSTDLSGTDFASMHQMVHSIEVVGTLDPASLSADTDIGSALFCTEALRTSGAHSRALKLWTTFSVAMLEHVVPFGAIKRIPHLGLMAVVLLALVITGLWQPDSPCRSLLASSLRTPCFIADTVLCDLHCTVPGAAAAGPGRLLSSRPRLGDVRLWSKDLKFWLLFDSCLRD